MPKTPLILPVLPGLCGSDEGGDRIDLGETNFGWFLCGPSKTADIEQSLVLGAHGPRSMRLVLVSG